MAGPLSQDLRDRLTAAVAAGSSARAAAERFGVSASTAIRWAQRWRAEGEARARPMGGDHRSRLSGHREAVLTLVAHQSDLTLAEIRAELAARHGIRVGQTTIWRFFERHRITVKKNKNGRTGCLLKVSGGSRVKGAGDVPALVSCEAGGRAGPGSAPVCLSGMRTGDADPL